jgi:putative phosphoesterase
MVYGHTHISLINQEENLLVINPGSPSMPRGGLPPSVALLTIENGKIRAELRQR